MTASLMGKFIDRDGRDGDLKGTLQVTEWKKSDRSPDPDRYPVTSTWYPDHWVFNFGTDIPQELQSFHMVPIVRTGQSGFFASGAEYSEGAVYLEGGQGRRIGRGFGESVSYANTTANMFRLAGLPDTPETLEQFKRLKPSALLKLWSMLYVAWPRYKAKLGGLLESFKKTAG